MSLADTLVAALADKGEALIEGKGSEGFDKLHYVKIAADGGFVVEDWINEVR